MIMDRRIKTTIYTVLLAAGLTIFLYGSMQVVKTYKRESIYIETSRTGSFPEGQHLKLVEQRGFKNGLLHVLLQGTGALISTAGLLRLASSTTRKN